MYIYTNFSSVNSTNIGISPQKFLMFSFSVLTLLPHWGKILSPCPHLPKVTVSNHRT